jgi:hypothetical protein
MLGGLVVTEWSPLPSYPHVGLDALQELSLRRKG